MNILAVDPSVNNVGLALLSDDKLKTWLLHPKQYPIEYRANEISRFIHISVLQGKKLDFIILEYPQFEGSERGAIANQKGYIYDLAFLVGMIAGQSGLGPSKILIPTPRDWKGNMPKKATEIRAQRKFGRLQISEHEWDAVGMLMWGMEQPAIANAIGGLNSPPEGVTRVLQAGQTGRIQTKIPNLSNPPR